MTRTERSTEIWEMDEICTDRRSERIHPNSCLCCKDEMLMIKVCPYNSYVEYLDSRVAGTECKFRRPGTQARKRKESEDG